MDNPQTKKPWTPAQCSRISMSGRDYVVTKPNGGTKKFNNWYQADIYRRAVADTLNSI